MTPDESLERRQPEPERDHALEGATVLVAADFERTWWLVPGARRARTGLFPLAALSVMFGLVTPVMPELAAFVLVLVTGAPYFSLWCLGRLRARRRVRALGAGPVVYRISGLGLEVRSSRSEQAFPWSELRGFVEAPDAWVIDPHRGQSLLLPKRAFAKNFEHVGWQLRRRLEERAPPNWGLRFGFGVGALLAFLTGWHFFTNPSAQELEELLSKQAEMERLAQGSAAPNEARPVGGAASDPTAAGR